jgi:hypothetical protein
MASFIVSIPPLPGDWQGVVTFSFKRVPSKDRRVDQATTSTDGEVSPLASLKIPDRYKPGIKILAALAAPQYAEFLAAVKRAPNTFATTREFEVWLTPEVPSISPTDVSKLIYSITSLYKLPTRYNVTASKLASDVQEGACSGIANFQTAEGSDFAQRLTELLAVGSFDIVAIKAQELQSEYERTFCEARILTDIRPVFGNKAEDSPTATIVVHTLKLAFHEMSGHKEFFVALDEDDIASLKKTLERAEVKAKNLKALLNETKLRAIDLE